MFKQFFCSGSKCTLAKAWLGILVISGHSVFSAYLKYCINEWFQKFYDKIQSASERLGEEGEEGEQELAANKAKIWELLLQFVLIVVPAVVVHPVAR